MQNFITKSYGRRECVKKIKTMHERARVDLDLESHPFGQSLGGSVSAYGFGLFSWSCSMRVSHGAGPVSLRPTELTATM